MRLITVTEDLAFAESVEREFAALTSQRHRIHPGGDRAMLRALGGSGTVLILDRRRVVRRNLWVEAARARDAGATGMVIGDLEELDPLAPESRGWSELRHDLVWGSTLLAQAIRRATEGIGWTGLQGGPDQWATAELASAAGKTKFLSLVSEALEKVGVPEIRRGRVVAVLEELLMNALYDAFGASAEDRKDPHFAMPGGQVARLAWSVSSESVWFKVADGAGSLQASTLYGILRDQRRNLQATVTRTQGKGGGVGLFSVLRHSQRFAAYVRPDQLTEIIVSLALASGQSEPPRETLTFFDPK